MYRNVTAKLVNLYLIWGNNYNKNNYYSRQELSCFPLQILAMTNTLGRSSVLPLAIFPFWAMWQVLSLSCCICTQKGGHFILLLTFPLGKIEGNTLHIHHSNVTGSSAPRGKKEHNTETSKKLSITHCQSGTIGWATKSTLNISEQVGTPSKIRENNWKGHFIESAHMLWNFT
jgi:hypothetical protein